MESIDKIFRTANAVTPEDFRYPERMNPGTILMFNHMIVFAQGRIPGLTYLVSADFSDPGGHEAPTSKHYTGEAIDFHFILKDKSVMPVLEQLAMAERFGWGGIGIYPHWISPGLHVDTRQIKTYEPGARWYRNFAGEYHSIETYLREVA